MTQDFLPGLAPESLPGDNLFSPEFNLKIDGLPEAPAPLPMSEIHERAFRDQAEISTSYEISEAISRTFDVRIPAEADAYAKFISEKGALFMSDPNTYKFSETPPQIVPFPNGGFAVVIVVKFWKQTQVVKAEIPSYTVIPRSNPL